MHRPERSSGTGLRLHIRLDGVGSSLSDVARYTWDYAASPPERSFGELALEQPGRRRRALIARVRGRLTSEFRVAVLVDTSGIPNRHDRAPAFVRLVADRRAFAATRTHIVVSTSLFTVDSKTNDGTLIVDMEMRTN